MEVYRFKLIESDGVVLIMESTCEHLAFMTLASLVADIDEWEFF